MIERNRFSYEQVFSWHTIKYKSSLGTSNEELAFSKPWYYQSIVLLWYYTIFLLISKKNYSRSTKRRSKYIHRNNFLCDFFRERSRIISIDI